MNDANTLDVVVPVYHEGASLHHMLQEWAMMFAKNDIQCRFLLCVDGTDEATHQAITHAQQADIHLVMLQSEKRRGYGMAVLEGIRHASSEYVLCVDSDGQYDPADFANLWSARRQAPVIKTIRTPRIDSSIRMFMSACFRFVFCKLFPSPYSDPSSPLMLFYRTSVIPLCSQLSYLNEGFWWGFVGTCIREKIFIYEIPCRHRPRTAGATVVYLPQKILQIGVRNLVGLLRLWAR